MCDEIKIISSLMKLNLLSEGEINLFHFYLSLKRTSTWALQRFSPLRAGAFAFLSIRRKYSAFKKYFHIYEGE